MPSVSAKPIKVVTITTEEGVAMRVRVRFMELTQGTKETGAGNGWRTISPRGPLRIELHGTVLAPAAKPRAITSPKAMRKHLGLPAIEEAAENGRRKR